MGTAPGTDLHELLKSLRVWAPELTKLPPLDPTATPDTPLPLFTTWFAEAVAAGETEPHVMSLATRDGDPATEGGGLPDVRMVMLHGADEEGWSFATHSTSRKGHQLKGFPYAALAFYWPRLGRQVRLRGPVTPATPTESQADLHAHSTGALAAALTGHQSEVLPSLGELKQASEEAWELAQREPQTPAPSWTLYRVFPDEVEFFQGDALRRHVRLSYVRGERGWSRELLWP
ncbi:pyridoxine/pyridoxamine 5'-phosphate oxidase [Streptomyces prunicolor]|uniref:pyridoxine/pyridoxamine 5'-phosphate oxidase n=1 Tax=Streptomyces prunicolor TaxID=67348 RepID=UPI00039DBD1A|nr:pyridoxal 5'-phosphate synthase [Streptomyces prunicolor]